MKKKRLNRMKGLLAGAATLTVCGLMAGSAQATTGYFAHGYSIKNKQMAGAGVALPLDSLATSMNPAGMAFVDKRVDAGLTLFNPNREYTTSARAGAGINPAGGGTVESDSEYFVIPSLGANWKLASGKDSLGIAIFGNGGMNTDYSSTAVYGGLGASTAPTGVDLSQLFVTPTYARKLNDNVSIGITPVLAYERFQAEGLQSFAGMSNSPGNLTNRDYEDSYGYGVRIGYFGQFTPEFALGVSYQSRIYMDNLDKYKGLFAEDGDFDIPSNFTIGAAVKPVPSVTVALDVQTIFYGEVRAIANPNLLHLGIGNLGTQGGAGFGWEDTVVIKLGVQWEQSADWTYRVGYSYNTQPIQKSEVLFNILAPGVVQNHITAGLTKKFGTRHEVDFSLMRALEESVKGVNPAGFGGQTVELTMDQWEAAVGYSWKF